MIYKFDVVLVVVSLLVLLGLVGYARPLVISPDGFDEGVLFRVDGVERIFISKNLDFSDADSYLLRDGLEVGLGEGEYYLGIPNEENEVRILRAETEINLIFRFDGVGYDVVGGEGKKLLVRTYRGDEIIKEFGGKE